MALPPAEEEEKRDDSATNFGISKSREKRKSTLGICILAAKPDNSGPPSLEKQTEPTQSTPSRHRLLTCFFIKVRSVALWFGRLKKCHVKSAVRW